MLYTPFVLPIIAIIFGALIVFIRCTLKRTRHTSYLQRAWDVFHRVQSSKRNRKIIRFTLGNKNHEGLRCSLRAHQGQWIVLEPSRMPYPYRHHVKEKLSIALNFILEQVGDEDLVAFHDGHDATVWCTEEDMIALFDEFDADIVVGAETNRYPSDGYETHLPYRFKYPNTGCYIGTKKALRHWVDFATANAEREGGDQESFHYWMQSNPPFRIAIDHEQKLMSNLWGAEECRPVNGINMCTGAYTCGMHTNGMGSEKFLELMKLGEGDK